jgi:hypothetical protein
LAAYGRREPTHREHAGEIQREYGYRDFSDASAQAELPPAIVWIASLSGAGKSHARRRPSGTTRGPGGRAIGEPVAGIFLQEALSDATRIHSCPRRPAR